MSWVFTAGQACSRHLGPNMGKTNLFSWTNITTWVCQLQQTLGTFSHLFFLLFTVENVLLVRLHSLPFEGFFQTLSVHLFFETFWALGVWKTQPERPEGYFCRLPCHILPPSWFSDLREGGRKKECKEENSGGLISQNDNQQLQGDKMTTARLGPTRGSLCFQSHSFQRLSFRRCPDLQNTIFIHNGWCHKQQLPTSPPPPHTAPPTPH